MGTYSLGDAARILRVSPDRLRYWERRALVRLRERDDARPVLGFRQLVSIKAILALLESGVPLRSIRRSVEALRERNPEIGDPVKSLRLWVEGSPRVVVDCGGTLFEPGGQMVLDFRPQSRPEKTVARIEHSTLARATAERSALDWFERGCTLDSDSKTYDQAAEAYRGALGVEPAFADAHCNLGAVLYHQGHRAAARRCFERCLELAACHVEAHFNLATLHEEEGSNDLSLKHYRAVLEADPLYADAYVHLALLYEKLQRRDDASGHWRRYLQLAPGGAWASVARARLRKEP